MHQNGHHIIGFYDGPANMFDYDKGSDVADFFCDPDPTWPHEQKLASHNHARGVIGVNIQNYATSPMRNLVNQEGEWIE